MARTFGRAIKQLFMLLLILVPASAALGQNQVVRVGIVVDGPWERNEEIMNLFQVEISDLLRNEFDIQFPPTKNLVADWTISGVKNAIDQLMADPAVDLVITSGVIASNDVCHRQNLSKPVVAPFVIDAVVQQLPRQPDGSSGIANLNYIALPSTFARDLEMFKEIVPFETVSILLNQRFLDAIPNMRTTMDSLVREIGVNARLIPIDRSADEFFNSLTGEEEAVYVAPLIHLPEGEIDRLIRGMIERNLPSFSLLGRSEVEQGMMATLSRDFFPRISRRIALNIQQILLGTDPGDISVAFTAGLRLTINMATVEAINVWPSWAVMNEAELINDKTEEVQRLVTLASAVSSAVEQNLDLVAKNYYVAAGRQDIIQARSRLLPQLMVSGSGLLIDEDRAAASFGSQAERTFAGSATVEQVIFSEPAWANHKIQGELQKSRASELNQLKLDIIRDAAQAYLNVLRTKTFERIQKDNLERSRANLELARVREAVGFSGRSEVFRWESEIASSQKAVIFSNASRNLAEISLNRLLHRPLEEQFATEETRIEDMAMQGVNTTFIPYRKNRVLFKAYRGFMVEEGLRNSPEIQTIDAAIAAQERLLKSTKRAFWSPTIALQAGVTNIFSESGAGVDSPFSQIGTLPIPGLDQLDFSEPDETNWNVGVRLSFPLFTSGSKKSTMVKANEEMNQLRVERQALVERIEQRIRSALHLAGASYAGIRQSQKAAEAANQNLDLVVDAYSSGTVSIIELIDAQNAALTANLGAANAIYDFLIDYVEMERSIGDFGFNRSPDGQEAFIKRIDDYFEQEGLMDSGQ